VLCDKCKQRGHMANVCRTLKCRRCGQLGHAARSCTQVLSLAYIASMRPIPAIPPRLRHN
jgi:hypothetical protein